MAKNNFQQRRSFPNKKKDDFFSKSKQNSKPFRSSKAEEKPRFKEKPQCTKNHRENDDFFKPSSSTQSDDFLVRKAKNTVVTRSENSGKPVRKFNKPNQPHQGQSSSQELQKSKRPFDKKKYRLQKYSYKYKYDQWNDRRKKAILRDYYKQVKDDEPTFDVKKVYEQYEDESNEESDNPERQKREPQKKEEKEKTNRFLNSQNQSESPSKEPKKKKKPFLKAHERFLLLKEEQKQKKEEALKKKAERLEAIKLSKEKRIEKAKKLSRRTKKGQPIMKDRIEMMLEQIQRSLSS